MSDPGGSRGGKHDERGLEMCWKREHPGGNNSRRSTSPKCAKRCFEKWLGGASIRRERSDAIRIHDRPDPLRVARTFDNRSLTVACGVGVEQRRSAGGEWRATDRHANRSSRGPLVEMVEVEHPDVYLIFAGAMFGDEVTALQVVWVDSRWPLAVGCELRPRSRHTTGARPARGTRLN